MNKSPLRTLMTLWIGLTLLVLSPIQGQSQEVSAGSNSNSKDKASGTTSTRRLGIGLHGGLIGVGADLGYQINPMLGVRAKYSALPVDAILGAVGYKMPKELNFKGTNLWVDVVTAKLDHADLIVDFHPFLNAFRLSAGLGIFSGNQIKVTANFLDSTKFGEITFTPDDIGSLGLNWVLNTVNPYVGFGFGRAAPKNRLGLGLDLGAYYIGPPKPEILATGMVKRTSEQSATLQENLKDFQWLPVLSFRLAVALF
ncbi:MAG: hypothetical protein ACKOBI_12230 [Bacteroidota bacterium]